ncbi:hypothetical protein [Terriglobus albidus]|uniref:hypothetical protein n=1 Tax=Terriglobus albidus TaxID=1592106 RepID=UPI0021DF849A|nr:hypothetical protein [Terriglobus albidus]
MKRSKLSCQCILLLSMLTPTLFSAGAQVYSPTIVREGAVDTTDLHRMAEGIVQNAHAETPRQKAEAIWRYFLTDGRFVRPGIFYHIPGWAYEEPLGEVLDPVKLVNSYGFGLCYQDAPLLAATWEAAGLPARVWFLTGHTVAEVYYDGAYHYYDSDMMGYTTVGNGPVWSSPVASVQQLADDPKLILDKLISEKMTRAGSVDAPWYPADLRAGAIPGLAELFSTRDDNYLYAGSRYPHGHTMDFTLRPGERMIRYYEPGEYASRYMPYHRDGSTWQEFPKDIGEILLVKNGPRSEKDERRWSVGVLEYRPDAAAQRAGNGKAGEWTYRIASPYVLIDAQFIADAGSIGLQAETSADDGHSWTPVVVNTFAGGQWSAAPGRLATTTHGQLNAVAGTYGYLLRLRSSKPMQTVPGLLIRSTFEVNPRTLPGLLPGTNRFTVTKSQQERHELPVHAETAVSFAKFAKHVTFESDHGQGYLRNEDGHDGELIFAFDRDRDGHLKAIDAGGRFLDLHSGLAPDKLTAETRKVTPWPAQADAPQSASIAWSTSEAGPWITVWSFAGQKPPSGDGSQKLQTLQWPEVDRTISGFPNGAGNVYVRYQFRNLAVDDVRLATMRAPEGKPTALTVTHCWTADGRAGSFSRTLAADDFSYEIKVPESSAVTPTALILFAGNASDASSVCTEQAPLQFAGSR